MLLQLCGAAFFKIDAMTMQCGKIHRYSMNFRCNAKFETEKQNFILNSHARKVAYENLREIMFVVLMLLYYSLITNYITRKLHFTLIAHASFSGS